MAKLTKRAKKASEAIDREKEYAIGEALNLVKDHASSKFDETVDVTMRSSTEESPCPE